VSDIVIPIELKEVIKEKHEDHEDHEEHEDHTTKATDDLEGTGEDSGFLVAAAVCPGRPSCITPIPVPVAGACTAAIFTRPSVLDAVVRNQDCDSHAYLTSGSV
jgi:hypothetical protein